MHALSSTAGSNCKGGTQCQNGNFESVGAWADYIKNQIEAANSVSIGLILKHYGFIKNIQDKKIRCPFYYLHKNKDRTPSFIFNIDANYYNCFGCGSNGGPVNFVIAIEKLYEEDGALYKYRAAQKILSLGFNSDIATINDYLYDPTETLTILIDFSNHIREKIKNNINDRKYMLFIDEICGALDTLHEKYKNKMSNDTLRVLIDRLKTKVEEYK